MRITREHIIWTMSPIVLGNESLVHALDGVITCHLFKVYMMYKISSSYAYFKNIRYIFREFKIKKKKVCNLKVKLLNCK